MFLRVPRLTPHLVRHVAALARLAARDAAAAAPVYGRAMAMFAGAAVAALFALAMACVLVLAAAWDTPWRLPVAAGLTAAFVIVALLLRASARRPLQDAKPFAATQRHVALDRELYAELRPASARTATPPPETQVETSRAEIRRVAVRTERASRTLRFPRSRTMQVLTRSGAAGSAALVAYLLQRRRGR